LARETADVVQALRIQSPRVLVAVQRGTALELESHSAQHIGGGGIAACQLLDDKAPHFGRVKGIDRTRVGGRGESGSHQRHGYVIEAGKRNDETSVASVVIDFGHFAAGEKCVVDRVGDVRHRLGNARVRKFARIRVGEEILRGLGNLSIHDDAQRLFGNRKPLDPFRGGASGFGRLGVFSGS